MIVRFIGITTGYGLGDRRIGVRVSIVLRIFSTALKPALGSTQSPMQRVLVALSLWGKAAVT
jgi:hypothetical protein